jgi:surface polysaccharide O-acyltransferase-like enzyme
VGGSWGEVVHDRPNIFTAACPNSDVRQWEAETSHDAERCVAKYAPHLGHNAMNPGKGNIPWLDHLRATATFSVIILHVAAPLLSGFEKLPSDIWWSGNLYDGLVRFCVPVFLMMSGALILPKAYESIPEFLGKRMSRIILPFLFWAGVYISLSLYTEYSANPEFSFQAAVRLILRQFLHGPSTHFWYVYMIAGLYLFFPIIGKWIRSSTDAEIQYFLALWLLTSIVAFPCIRPYFPNIELMYFSGFIGYPILGYYLMDRVPPPSKKLRSWALLMVTSGILVSVIGTYYLTSLRGTFDNIFYQYLSPNVILASCGVFLLFKDIPFMDNKILSFISKYSYGIYLSHILIIRLIHFIGLTQFTVHPVIAVPLISLLCLSIAAPLVWITSKLPYGKYFAG